MFLSIRSGRSGENDDEHRNDEGEARRPDLGEEEGAGDMGI